MVSVYVVLFRVRRLGYYDHTQRQLGERALYVFPAKGDATRITCEGPEGAPILPEDPVARKVCICDVFVITLNCVVSFFFKSTVIKLLVFFSYLIV